MKSTTTYSKQCELPKLHIPELKDTLELYIQTLEPLVSDEKELNKTKQLCEEFLTNKQLGPRLQEELIKYANSSDDGNDKQKSYIEEFWDLAYLAYTVPTPINVNPVFVLEDDPTPARNQQIPRATSLILSSLKFVRAVRTETLSPDMVKGNKPLCMHQFKSLFGTARIPKNPTPDIVVTVDNSTHIVVLARGQFYYFDALLEDGHTICITEREIAKNLLSISQDAAKISESDVATSAVGVLTSQPRTEWAKQREELISISPENAKILSVIDSALFIVCLDEISPDSVSAMAANTLHGTYSLCSDSEYQIGTCISRWYDKLQIIVTMNGNAGVNFEHSAVDGHTVLRYASDVFTDTIIRFAQTISGGIASVLGDSSSSSASHDGKDQNKITLKRPDLKPRKLEFVLTHRIRSYIHYAESALADEVLRNDTQVLEYTGYGKQYIVQNNLSPDAFVQLAMLSSYYILYGKMVNTYESVLTKGFFHGRTEAGRSATMEAKAFVEIYTDPNSKATEKIQALRDAISAHTKMTSRCAMGKGVDRHLYALKCLHAKLHPNEPAPKIFEDSGWKILNETILSTSNCGNPSLRLFGFGPVSEKGFGIGYLIRDDSIHFCITSKMRQTSRYKTMLSKYLDTIQDMLIGQIPRRASMKNLRSGSQTSKSGYDFFGLSETDSYEVGKLI